MKLLGSTTSPFVRRIRLYLINIEVTETACEFINLDIFDTQDRAFLTQNNPAQKIPVLIDDDNVINDSGVIYRYLAQKFNQPALTWQQENLLTEIDAANDSMVSMLLLMRSGIDVKQDALFFNLQKERVGKILDSLNEAVADDVIKQWDYVAISLYCLLDWLSFREIYFWQDHNSLLNFFEKAKYQKGIKETVPRI
ncbi:glutathione S-transferase family protein [Thalassotalea profundi]|uniref:Glutathione S-transferase n=1 Tax=Thalassotalea profundi TaxID=2036687 RepID=A0ABQ3IKC7_9GAMM|nr:glutathione S-transferase family protein [Thalassotalea profundi]GHE81529.1 glutathione S-transferase [Thalassotalea profundi]